MQIEIIERIVRYEIENIKIRTAEPSIYWGRSQRAIWFGDLIISHITQFVKESVFVWEVKTWIMHSQESALV